MIDAAHADGKGVILTLYTIPPWVAPTNGATGYRFPTDVSTTSPWAAWLRFLAQRYAGRVTAIEICNEPNGQMSPIYDSNGSLTANCKVAQIMQTADAVFRAVPGAPYIMVPATSDNPNQSSTSYPAHLFATKVLDALDAIGWHPGPNFIWTHHTYWEVEQSYSGSNSIVSKIRTALRNRWTGYGGPSDPRIWITEGGARLQKLSDRYNTTDHATLLDKQQQVFVDFWNRMYTGSEGAGVDMVGWYLFQTALSYDCGLCEQGDGTFFGVPPSRPVYYKWGNRPYFP
jgi:hypothetical protein